jgi:excinuclease UvrABC nuclease subunit
LWEHDFCAISLLASMPTNDSELQAQARRILDTIAFTPFEQCQPLTREFDNIPARPGIYAVRHITDGLLYIGKTKSLRGRFSGGHKAFLWAWLDKYNDEDVRIAMQLIPHCRNPALLLELEAIILRATEPPYNVQIPTQR